MANQSLVWGTVDSDITVRTVGDQNKKVAEFRVNDGSTWITIVGWENLADKAQTLTKGDYVVVGGKLRTRSFTPNGLDHKHYVTEVVASSIDPLGAPAADDGEDLIGD